MTDQDITLGEIGRSVDRIEAMVNSLSLNVQATTALVTAHNVKIDVEARRVDDLDKKVESLATRSAYISGGIATIVAALNYFFGRH